MRWGSLGSIGLIAFTGCTGPVVAQQTQPRPRLASSYQPAPPPNWTGPQVGGFGGGSFGSPFSFAEPGAHLCTGSGLGPVTPGCFETPFQFSDHRWSPTFGAFAGYNAQFGNLVVGSMPRGNGFRLRRTFSSPLLRLTWEPPAQRRSPEV